MQRVEGGMLDERVPVAHATTRSARCRAASTPCSARLAEADGEIRAFNRRLADEVKAATLDLARKNETLAQLNRLLRETRQELGDKERLAALGQLAAQLAHEIGTPLGSVSGHLQLALSGRDVPPSLKDRLQVATRELERVSKIVRDYLDSTRTVAPERVPVDVERVVDEALGISIGAEARARIDVQKTIERRGGARRDRSGPVAADPGQPHHQRRRRGAGRRRPHPRRGGGAGRRGGHRRGRRRRRHRAPRTRRASSSRSTRPRGAARAPGSAWPSAASWRRRSAGASPSSRRRGAARPSP